MNNEHNPIARRINKIQRLWITERSESAATRFYYIVCVQEDFVLVNSFIKLEASEHGITNDSFLGFMHDFNNAAQYLADLANEWLAAFAKEAKEFGWNWVDHEQLSADFKQLDQQDTAALNTFIVRLCTSFKTFEGKKNNLLIINLSPRNISDPGKMVDCLINLADLLPPEISFLLVDFEGKERYSRLVEKKASFVHKISIPNLDMQGSYEELMTQGNPNDPQLQFRTCMLEMGKAASKNNKTKLDEWGEKMLGITQRSGIKSFWASACLVYAGFLFGFKDAGEQIHSLLDKGIRLTQTEYKEKADSAGVLLQLYAYKGSYFSMSKEPDAAVQQFLLQASTAKELKSYEQTFTAYLYALLVLDRNKNKQYYEILDQAYTAGYILTDEILRTLNFAYVALQHIEETKPEKSRENEINERMTSVYGTDWKLLAQKTKRGFGYGNQIVQQPVKA